MKINNNSLKRVSGILALSLSCTFSTQAQFISGGGGTILLNPADNVGVGVPSPAFKLDVDGDVNIPLLKSYKVSGSNFLTAKDNDNIMLGLGTGDPLITGFFNSAGNIFVGNGAGASSAWSFNNMFIGHGAGAAHNAMTFGGANIFLGNGSGNMNNSQANTFLGFYSGSHNTGQHNAFLGAYTGVSYSSGNASYCTFLGSSTGTSIFTGDKNTMVGYNANGLNGITNATAIGADAYVGQSNSLILGSGAKVGIGTSAPLYMLDVVGQERVSGIAHIGDNTSSIPTGDGRLTVYSVNPTPSVYGFTGTYHTAGLFVSEDKNASFTVKGVDAYAIRKSTREGAMYAIGVDGDATSQSPASGCAGYSVGVRGSGSLSKVNIGVWGDASGSDHKCEPKPICIGVYGEANSPFSTNYDYASYSNGSINVVGSVYSLSDQKFKKDVKEFDQSVRDRFMKLRAVNYTYNAEEYPTLKFDNKKGYGFIAQEVEALFPDLVKDNLHPDFKEQGKEIAYKSINYVSMVPIITNALQEEIKTTEVLKEEIKTLEQRLNQMEAILLGKTDAQQATGDAADYLKVSDMYANAAILSLTPNPAKTEVSILYSTGKENKANAYIRIVDVKGIVKYKYAGLEQGVHTLVANLNLFTGEYYCQFVVNETVISSKKLLVE